ncbi:MAG: tetratricopeptide repeat protein, partial [Armatimonadota bacterium]
MHPRSTVALSLIAVALAGLLVLAGEAQAATQKAKVTRLVGDVTHRAGAEGQWVQSRAGSLLPGGSRLRTGPGGRAEIAFPDGTVFRMGQRSDLVVQAATQAKVSRGQIYARIIAGTAMKVSGATATAAVRGTTLSLEVAEDGTTVLTVATGEVDFYNDLGSVVVAESQQSTARPGEAPTRPIVIDPSSLQAWEASLDGLIIELEQPPHVETDPERLQQQLPQRRDAVEQQPEDASTHADLSRVLLDLGRSEEAVAEAERAVELAPEAAEYQGLMGYALLQAGRLDQAEGAFEEAARGEPGNVRWVIGRAVVALGRNDDEAAADV